MIVGQNFFDQSIKNDLRIYDNIRKIAIGQRDDFTVGSLLDYPYFKEYDKLMVIGLSKQEPLDADTKKVQQTNFTGNLD